MIGWLLLGYLLGSDSNHNYGKSVESIPETQTERPGFNYPQMK